MGKTVQIRVDKSLIEILNQLRKDIATDLKQKYGLEEIVVPQTLTSEILAAKLRGQETLRFKINRSSRSKGVLQII